MDAKTAKALEGSIEKWERIVRSTRGVDRHSENCPLCNLYTSGCRKCIVRQKTKRSSCSGSPFAKWNKHQWDDHAPSRYPMRRFKGCEKCLKLAEAELEFLKSLREPKGA